MGGGLSILIGYCEYDDRACVSVVVVVLAVTLVVVVAEAVMVTDEW